MFYKNSRKVERMITAERADLKFYASEGNDELPDSIAIMPRQATTVELPDYHITKAANLLFRGTIREKMSQHFSSMSLRRLLAMSDNPELYKLIRQTAEQARRAFIAARMVKGLQHAINRDGYFELFSPQYRYHFTGQLGKLSFGHDEVRNVLRQATIEEYSRDSDKKLRVFTDVDQLNLELVQMLSQTADVGEERLTASMVLRNAHISSSGAAEEVLERSRFSIGGLQIPEDVLKRGNGLSLEQITKGDFIGPKPEKFASLARSIRKQMATLSKRIVMEIHLRGAMAVCCPVLAILGALLGAIFRKGQFLVAVGLSLVPAMMALLFINMGKQMVRTDTFSTGFAVATVWTGLVLLAATNMVLLVKVMRK